LLFREISNNRLLCQHNFKNSLEICISQGIKTTAQFNHQQVCFHLLGKLASVIGLNNGTPKRYNSQYFHQYYTSPPRFSLYHHLSKFNYRAASMPPKSNTVWKSEQALNVDVMLPEQSYASNEATNFRP